MAGSVSKAGPSGSTPDPVRVVILSDCRWGEATSEPVGRPIAISGLSGAPVVSHLDMVGEGSAGKSSMSVGVLHLVGHGAGPDEVSGYRLLLTDGSLTTGDLAERLAVPRVPRGNSVFQQAASATQAVLAGDTETLDAFITNYLGKSPKHCREAVATALLDNWWTSSASMDDEALTRLLRIKISQATAALKPVWERQVYGRKVRLLSEPAAGDASRVSTLAGSLTDGSTAEDVALAGHHDDACVSEVLGWLTPEEAKIVAAYAEEGGLSWKQAATTAGATDPGIKGERVRRKLKRLGNEHRRRAQALLRTSNEIVFGRCRHCSAA